MKENEKKDKYFDLAGELIKTAKHKSIVYTKCIWCSWYSHQRINKWNGELGYKRMSSDHPNYCITEIKLNTEKSPGDLKRLVVTQTSVKHHQLTLMWKILKEKMVTVRLNKKDNRVVDFDVLAEHRVVKKENEKRNKYLDLAIELKTMEHENDGDANCGWCTWNNP